MNEKLACLHIRCPYGHIDQGLHGYSKGFKDGLWTGFAWHKVVEVVGLGLVSGALAGVEGKGQTLEWGRGVSRGCV